MKNVKDILKFVGYSTVLCLVIYLGYLLILDYQKLLKERSKVESSLSFCGRLDYNIEHSYRANSLLVRLQEKEIAILQGKCK